MDREQFVPRTWQNRCMAVFQQKKDQKLFTIGAVPGAGKSKMAAWASEYCIDDLGFNFIVVISPQEGKKTEWVDDFWRYFGIPIQANYSSGARWQRKVFSGIVLTYSGLNDRIESDLRDKVRDFKTLVIADEPHHLSESDGSKWGEMFTRIFKECADKIIYLSGTYWREDKTPIPLIPYDPEKGEYLLDFIFSYTDGIVSGTSRKTEFIIKDPDLYNFRFRENGEDGCFNGKFSDLINEHGEVILNSCYSYLVKNHHTHLMPIIQDALEKLDKVKTDPVLPMPNAKMAIWAPTIEVAKAITKDLNDLNVYDCVLVHSKDPDSSNKLEEFKKSKDRVLISVGMFSEGIDVPETRVSVYLGLPKTRLSFVQGPVGRAIRVTSEEYNAFKKGTIKEPLYSYVYILAHPLLVEYTRMLEKEMGEAEIIIRENRKQEKQEEFTGEGSGEGQLFDYINLEGLNIEDTSVMSRGNQIESELFSKVSGIFQDINIPSEYEKSTVIERFAAVVSEEKQAERAKNPVKVKVNPITLRKDLLDNIGSKAKYIGIRIKEHMPLIPNERQFIYMYLYLQKRFNVNSLNKKKCEASNEKLQIVSDYIDRLVEDLNKGGPTAFKNFYHKISSSL